MKNLIALMCACMLASLASCASPGLDPASSGGTFEEPTVSGQVRTYEPEDVPSMQVGIGDRTFTATLEDNVAAEALMTLLAEGPVVLDARDYSGFEKVAPLPASLPATDVQMTTEPGDIVLYNGNQIVVFYGSNSWSYTKLAAVDDLEGWEDALGSGDATITLSLHTAG